MVMDYLLIFCITQTIFNTVSVNGDILDERFRLLYSDVLECSHDKSLNLDVSEVQIYFYDYVDNVYISSNLNDAAVVIAQVIKKNLERKIVFFVPGYKCFIQRDLEERIRQTFRHVSDVYLIIVDHSAYTHETVEKLKSYSRSVLYSYYIGDALGKLLANITNAGYSSDKIHAVGHSLGGQMLGYASDSFFRETSQRIGKVTGLDPAGPCYNWTSVEDQLRSGVAKYVEVYHCNAGHLGTTSFLGDVDFIFNKQGKIQPGCEGLELEDTAKCYHKACLKFWTDTVRNPDLYLATSCSSYEAFMAGLCTENHNTTVGYHSHRNITGKYYVLTEKYMI